MERPPRSDSGIGALPSRGRVFGIVICLAALFEIVLAAGDIALVDRLFVVSTHAAMVVAVSEALRGKGA